MMDKSTNITDDNGLFTDCVEDQYLFGRDSKCDYVLGDPNDRGSKKFLIYSKKHFRIYRVRLLLVQLQFTG